MKNYISTLFYSINHFENNNGEVFDLDILDDSFSENNDIFDLLTKVEVSPAQKCLDNIMNYSRSINCKPDVN
ncbi:MAG: hypothetical protein CSA05_02470 [Bacteroidia bacterium]|nr:MAG: hypothetical protein CSA05_02470 [Bacteroidia bacterium]